MCSSQREREGWGKADGPWPADKKFLTGAGGRGWWAGHRKQADQFPSCASAFCFIFLYYTLLNTSVFVNEIKFNKFISVRSNFCS